jgi:hypothetical protein
VNTANAAGTVPALNALIIEVYLVRVPGG